MPQKKNRQGKKQMQGEGIKEIFNSVKQGLHRLDQKLQHYKPLSTVDKIVGKQNREAFISALPMGSTINQGYNLGLKRGYGKKQKKK